LLPVVVALAMLGVLFTAAALRWLGFVGAALTCLAGEYLLTEAAGSVATVSLVFYAAGLLVLCELIFLAGQLRALSRVDGAGLAAWLRHLALTGVASAVLAVVTLAAARLRVAGSLTITIVGSAAVVILLGLPWFLSRRTSRR
jgi:hypothetical protein